MAPHVNDNLDLFYQLIADKNIPDVEIDQVMFAFFGVRWDVQITRSEVMDVSEKTPIMLPGYTVTFTIDNEVVAEYDTKYKNRAITLCIELVEKYVSEGEDIDVAERYLTASE